MIDLYRKLQNVVRRAFVDRPGIKPSLAHLGDSIAPDVEVMQPQGLHFVAPAGAQGVLLAPSAITSSAFAVGLGGDVPSDSVAPGEGGLHYLGVFKLFIKADGTIAVGAYAPDDWIALASKTDARISALENAFNSHTHPETGTTTSTPTAPLTPGSSVASAKVRAE